MDIFHQPLRSRFFDSLLRVQRRDADPPASPEPARHSPNAKPTLVSAPEAELTAGRWLTGESDGGQGAEAKKAKALQALQDC